ncbi:hypothetical protein D3C84_1049600 [compost metagenome]
MFQHVLIRRIRMLLHVAGRRLQAEAHRLEQRIHRQAHFVRAGIVHLQCRIVQRLPLRLIGCRNRHDKRQ